MTEQPLDEADVDAQLAALPSGSGAYIPYLTMARANLREAVLRQPGRCEGVWHDFIEWDGPVWHRRCRHEACTHPAEVIEAESGGSLAAYEMYPGLRCRRHVSEDGAWVVAHWESAEERWVLDLTTKGLSPRRDDVAAPADAPSP